MAGGKKNNSFTSVRNSNWITKRVKQTENRAEPENERPPDRWAPTRRMCRREGQQWRLVVAASWDVYSGGSWYVSSSRSSSRCRGPPNTSVPSAMPPTRNTRRPKGDDRWRQRRLKETHTHTHTPSKLRRLDSTKIKKVSKIPPKRDKTVW
jgi:hypothetical protein